ncbi:MAG: site-specific integrase [Bacteroidales bacterium]|nr:site-specific integrase [Bacteroidales bacterium]
MASIKILLYTHKTLGDGRHPLMMQLIHNRKTRRINLGYNLYKEEWDAKNMKVKGKSDLAIQVNAFLIKELDNANSQYINFKRLNQDFTLDELVDKIKKPNKVITFTEYCQELIQRMRNADRLGNADSYKWALNKIQNFAGKKNIQFQEINFKFLTKLQEDHLSNGNTINSLNVYLRAVRAIYNKAINEGVVAKDHYPFDKFKIKNERTQKRAISKGDIKKIVDLELIEDTELWHTRNYFLFSFYTIGMNWTDMAKLKVENIVDGRIIYKRTKTHKLYSIAINPQIEKILNCYANGKLRTDFIFPIIERPNNNEDTLKDIRNKLKTYNKYLKTLGIESKIDSKLTSYVSRHSWASIANFAGTQLGVISQGLGHSDLKTTQTYLAEFDNSDIDQANANIL